jgi:Uncharacterized protein containing caspase domain
MSALTPGADSSTKKRGDFSAARSDYRAASVVLTKVDHTDTGIARRLARERLAVLMAALQAQPNPEIGKPAPGTAAAPAPPSGLRKVALIVGNGAYQNVRQLDNPPRDAQLIADTFRGLGFATTLAPDLTRDQFFAACASSAPRRKRPIGRWSIMPVTAWKSAASII